MPRYVVLNLADPEGYGAISKVKLGLEARVKKGKRLIGIGDDTVPVYDLFDMLALAKDNSHANLGDGLAAVRNDCDAAEKIFLCTHGTATDTEHGFANASGGQGLATWKGFGKLMRQVLPRTDKTYDLALVMCYGARTEDYRASELDHQGMIPASLLKTSFAYKFFRYLCRDHGRRLRMTARTGAVGFDQVTGRSTVEQEAAIDIGLEIEEYLRKPKINAILEKWKRYKQNATTQESQTKWALLDHKLRKDPKALVNPFSGLQRAGKAYHQVIARKNKLELRGYEYKSLEKYGKLVYEVVTAGVRIVNKYGGGNGGIGPNTVLYEGAFI